MPLPLLGLCLIISAIIWLIPKFRRAKYRRVAEKCEGNRGYQRKVLEKCTKEELEILKLLYNRYPTAANYRVDNDSIMRLYDKGFLVASPLIVLRSNQFQRMYTLQEWVKEALDGNQDVLEF